MLGVYSIVDHGRHTHLAYELEIPKEPGDVQKHFCILKEGNYIINIKVPHAEHHQRQHQKACCIKAT